MLSDILWVFDQTGGKERMLRTIEADPTGAKLWDFYSDAIFRILPKEYRVEAIDKMASIPFSEKIDLMAAQLAQVPEIIPLLLARNPILMEYSKRNALDAEFTEVAVEAKVKALEQGLPDPDEHVSVPLSTAKDRETIRRNLASIESGEDFDTES